MNTKYTVKVVIRTAVEVEVVATWNEAEEYAEISDIRLPFLAWVENDPAALNDDDRDAIDEAVREAMVLAYSIE